MNIQPARQQDLPEIMAVQRAAFEAEAQLVNDWNIPPLTQTLDELADDLRKGIMLMAVNEDGKIVGTVRGHKAPDGFYIGRLAVLPQWQGRGMGSALLEAIIDLAQTTPKTAEQVQTCANRLVLFTSTKSERNLRLYERFGFKPFKNSTTATGVPLVWLEKVRKIHCGPRRSDLAAQHNLEKFRQSCGIRLEPLYAKTK